MNAADVAQLSHSTTYPAISLLLPVAGDPLDRVRRRLRGLVVEAVERLRDELDPGEVDELADRLRIAVDRVDLVPGQEGIAVYVGDHTATVPLSVGVRERVVVDDTFATRDLVRALQRSPRYRVAVLGRRDTRLFDGIGLGLTEVDSSAFLVDQDLGPTGGGRVAARGRVSRETRRDTGGATRVDAFVRAFDDALDAHVREEPLPLVVVGAEPRLSAVANGSRHRQMILGTVRGARDTVGLDELGRQVWPIIAEKLDRDTAAAIDELERVGGSHRYASGFREVWLLANEGRGDLLLVEEGFEQPSRVDAATGNAEVADDRDAPGVVDDLIDEIIEVVLAKGGRCAMVPDGSLAAHDRIAMKLRF